VGGGVEAVDGPVLVGSSGWGAEDLDAEVAGEGPGGAADAGQELLVGGLMAGLDPPGDRDGDRPLQAGRLRIQTHHPTALVVACWVGWTVVVALMAWLPLWMPVPSRLWLGC
jgi:hypothetical protein